MFEWTRRNATDVCGREMLVVCTKPLHSGGHELFPCEMKMREVFMQIGENFLAETSVYDSVRHHILRARTPVLYLQAGHNYSHLVAAVKSIIVRSLVSIRETLALWKVRLDLS